MLIAALQFYAFDFEVHSKGAGIVRLERFLAVPHQKARLGHSTAPTTSYFKVTLFGSLLNHNPSL